MCIRVAMPGMGKIRKTNGTSKDVFEWGVENPIQGAFNVPLNALFEYQGLFVVELTFVAVVGGFQVHVVNSKWAKSSRFSIERRHRDDTDSFFDFNVDVECILSIEDGLSSGLKTERTTRISIVANAAPRFIGKNIMEGVVKVNKRQGLIGYEESPQGL